MCETATLVVFFGRFLGRKYNSKLPYILSSALYFVLNMTASTWFKEFVPLLTPLVCFALSLTLYNGTKTQRLFYSGLLVAYIFVAESFVMVALTFAFGRTMLEIAQMTTLFYLGAYSSKVLLLILAFVVSGRRKTRVKPVPFTYHLFLLFIVCICAGLSVGDMVLVAASGEPATLMHLLFETAFLLLSVLVFFVFEKFQSYAEHELQTTMIEQQLAKNELLFETIESQHTEIRAIKHDMVNHLTSIGVLADNGQVAELQDYIGEYIKDSQAVMSPTITGRPSVDAIITEKRLFAEQENIRFGIVFDELSDVLVNPVHLNIILSNALDNALDACRALSTQPERKRYIELQLKTEPGFLLMRVSNSSPEVSTNDGEFPITSKAEKNLHGFGLASIKRVVERNRGVMFCEYKDGEFVFMAQIFNSKVNT